MSYKFHEEPKREQGPPVNGELAVVTLPVNVVFERSDKIIADCDYDEDGNVIESSIVYKSGLIMRVLPDQKAIYRGEQRQTIAHTFKEKYPVEVFTNKDRNRYYGKRIGDIVKSKMYPFGKHGLAIVVMFGHMDNNSILVSYIGETETQAVVAEWCDVVMKVEDLNKTINYPI